MRLNRIKGHVLSIFSWILTGEFARWFATFMLSGQIVDRCCKCCGPVTSRYGWSWAVPYVGRDLLVSMVGT